MKIRILAAARSGIRRSSSSSTYSNNSGSLGAVKGAESLKQFIKIYGKVGVLTYGAVSAASCSFWYLAFKYGLDIGPIKRLMKDVHIPDWFLDSKYATNAPLIALIWSAHTVIFPIRLGTTLIITRLLVRAK